MINNKALSALAGLFLATTSLSSQAGIMDGWGVSASTNTASNCPSYCSSANGGDFQYNSQGGELSTYAIAEENSYGYSKALADLSGAGYLPTLKVMASAGAGKGASASAFASQGFDYLGTETTTFNLDINLHGSVGNNAGGYSNNSLSAHIGILIGSSMPFYPSFGTAYYEAGMMSGAIGVGTEFLSISDGNDVNKQGSISFELDPGESFYVLTEMNANSKNGFSDAWNTLTMSFEDNSMLQAASIPQPSSDIPEPSALILILLALMFLFRQQLNNQK